MSKPKGKISVRAAVEKIYPMLPRRFSMMRLHAEVIREIRRPYLFLDTTRRKLQELRDEGLVDYDCIDRQKSLYHKNYVSKLPVGIIPGTGRDAEMGVDYYRSADGSVSYA